MARADSLGFSVHVNSGNVPLNPLSQGAAECAFEPDCRDKRVLRAAGQGHSGQKRHTWRGTEMLIDILVREAAKFVEICGPDNVYAIA